jgi:hypothetical protein
MTSRANSSLRPERVMPGGRRNAADGPPSNDDGGDALGGGERSSDDSRFLGLFGFLGGGLLTLSF